jgi:glucose-6-phosphate isomerase
VSNNINLRNSISRSYYNKKSYSRDKKRLNKIISDILFSLNNKKDVFYSFSKNFNFNFTYPDLLKFNRYKFVILIGMGGSSLGAEAIYSFFKDRIKKNFIFIDNLDQFKISKNLNLKNSLFIIISKSGNTLETLVNSNLFQNKIRKNNTIIITEKNNNLLHMFARNRKILTIEHKDYIGGRYSVLSEVGMVPAYFMGLKIKRFRKNLLDFLKSRKKDILVDNSIKLSHIYKHKKIKSIILLNYAPEVNDFLYWYQQLMAESLGKKGKGILPVISPSPKDHHSLMQLYLDGPKDKLFFIFNSETNKKIKIRRNIFGETFNYIKNKDYSKIKEAQKNALKKILKKKNIPYQEFEIKKNNEETLGELFSYFIIKTVLVGKLLAINPFNQPAVEEVKILTKEYLS